MFTRHAVAILLHAAGFRNVTFVKWHVRRGSLLASLKDRMLLACGLLGGIRVISQRS